MKRLICWILGHRWKVHHSWDIHGRDDHTYCERCDAIWEYEQGRQR